MKFLNNLDLHQNEIQNFRVQNLATAPSNPVVGQHYYNTTSNTEFVWNGTKWIDALSQGDYTFKNGIVEDENREVGLTGATKTAIGGVIVGDNIDVAEGKISVKSGNKTQAGLLQLASDEEAAAGENDAKAVTAKQVETQIQNDIADKIELTDLSAEGPITYNDATGVISANFDAEATAGSINLMKSGAIKAELDKKLDKTVFEGAKLSDFEDDTDVNPVKEAQNLTGLNTTVAELNEIHEAGAVKADLVKLHAVTADAAEINVLDGITASTTELNYVKGVTSAIQTQIDSKVAKNADIEAATHTKITYDAKGLVTAGEDLAEADIPALHLTKVTDITATAAEVNELHEGTAVKADFIKLHGITADAAEINVLDGITATTAELNILDGVTANADEINVLDGITATTEELNQVHESGVVKADLVKLHAITATAEQINAITEVDAEDLAKLADITASAEEINILDGATVTTAELNVLDGITATTAELNQLHDSGVEKADLAKLHDVTVTAAEINELDGITGNVQDQIDDKVAKNDAIEGATKCKITFDEKGLVTGGADLVLEDIPDLSSVYVNVNRIGKANGVASLDENGLVPAAQLPSYVDDIIDLVAIQAAAPAKADAGSKYFNTTDKKVYTATAADTWGNAKDPETDKIYVNLSNNMAYRWSGSAMVQIGADKLLGFNGAIEGDGTQTSFVINHNLGTRNVVFEIYEANSPYEKVYVQVLHTSTTALTVVFGAAPAVGENYVITCIAIG